MTSSQWLRWVAARWKPGGLTTYSAMMLDMRTLGAEADWLLADAYLLATLAGGLLGVWHDDWSGP